ncbi:DUF4007 family protein [Leeuwenhoekiella sp. NPDC079379]|uniref:DUF4007 family protein n=1 Tax=Leeuwenhoekiella sp. NPDC079379 TaxID=3364122 RepID=UPI0037CB95E8
MTFSGHDTFHCRLFWLKKGYDYIIEGNKFQDDSGVYLGVGRNMVNSIRFWLKAFGVNSDDYEIKDVYHNLLADNGWDPYLENEGTLYLLHYQLCANEYASSYNIIFRDFRKVKPEFSKENFVQYVSQIAPDVNEKSLAKDFSVFLRMYLNSKESIEDGYSGLLTELSLLQKVGKNQSDSTLYRVENRSQQEVPNKILLYCILSNPDYGNSISFKSLYTNKNGVGNIFCFDQDILEEKLKEIAEVFDFINYNSEAGVKELQIKKEINPLEVLESYYE